MVADNAASNICDALNDHLHIDNQQQQQRSYSQEENENFLSFFKSCVVANEKPLLIERLEQTITLRCSLLNQDSLNILTAFPFYFHSPDLVSPFRSSASNKIKTVF